MIFPRPTAFGPAVRIKPQPRRGTFALEPVEALPRLSDRIRALAERALEPNPFFLPEFLAPAIGAFKRKGLRLAVFSDSEHIRFFAPVVATEGGLLRARKLSVWTHPYAPLGAPLIDAEAPDQAADALITHMRASKRRVLQIPDLPLDGPAARVLAAAAARRGAVSVAARQMRPILYRQGDVDPLSEFERMVSHKRRRELDRQLRRLCESGAVSFMSAQGASEIEAAFVVFAGLETSGWKGRRGTALQRSKRIHEFARTAVTQLAQQGRAAIDVMRVGDKPVAALIRLEHAGLSIPWKVAFDERFAAFSPGKQLMSDETRRWLSDPAVRRVDPVCEEGNPLLSSLWADREPYGTLLVGTRRWAPGVRLRAGLINLKTAGKHAAKRLVGRSAPRPKSGGQGAKRSKGVSAGRRRK
jgi:CelD/BcsL family acetyltransferase involved in cellulose biosynthesis